MARGSRRVLYLSLTFWLLVIVLTAWGVHRILADLLKPKVLNTILLPGTLVARTRSSLVKRVARSHRYTFPQCARCPYRWRFWIPPVRVRSRCRVPRGWPLRVLPACPPPKCRDAFMVPRQSTNWSRRCCAVRSGSAPASEHAAPAYESSSPVCAVFAVCRSPTTPIVS